MHRVRDRQRVAKLPCAPERGSCAYRTTGCASRSRRASRARWSVSSPRAVRRRSAVATSTPTTWGSCSSLSDSRWSRSGSTTAGTRRSTSAEASTTIGLVGSVRSARIERTISARGAPPWRALATCQDLRGGRSSGQRDEPLRRYSDIDIPAVALPRADRWRRRASRICTAFGSACPARPCCSASVRRRTGRAAQSPSVRPPRARRSCPRGSGGTAPGRSARRRPARSSRPA